MKKGRKILTGLLLLFAALTLSNMKCDAYTADYVTE